jgi:hypothetical protein
MMIEFHNPEGVRRTPAIPYDLSLNLTESPTATVGLLANGFPDSVAFLDAVETVLQRRCPQVLIMRFDKGNASIVAPADLVTEMVDHCDGLIAAYGH